MRKMSVFCATLLAASTVLVSCRSPGSADQPEPVETVDLSRESDTGPVASEAQSQSKPKAELNKTYGFKPEVFQWILDNNSGLKRDFIVKGDPGKEILLPDGEKVPIYRTKQFLRNNFRYRISSEKGFNNKQEEALDRMWGRMLKMMAHPRFQRFVYKKESYRMNTSKKHRWTSKEVYRNFRKNGKGINVYRTALSEGTAGKGGGAKIWINSKHPFKNDANWLGTLFHELTHCAGYLHESSIPDSFGNHFRDASKKKDYWNYQVVDPNSMTIPE